MERKKHNKNLKDPKEAPRKPWRNIHMADGTIWGWMKKGGAILFLTPSGSEKIVVPETDFTGYSWDALERAHYKRWYQGVLPSQVKNWIEQRLIPTPGTFSPIRFQTNW